MAAISLREIDGPIFKANLHLDMLYISFQDQQLETLADGTTIESNYTMIDIYLEKFNLNDFGLPDLSNSIGFERFTIQRSNLWQLKETGLPEYSIRIKMDKNYYKVRMRLGEVLDENSPGSTIYSQESTFVVSNGTNWIYPESFQDLITDSINTTFENKRALYIFGNVLPIGGTSKDIQILNPNTAFCQEFSFDDFYEKDIYSAAFDSINISWWEIDVVGSEYNKMTINKDSKKLLSTLINIPGVRTIIKSKQQLLTAQEINSLYGLQAQDANLYIPFSFTIGTKLYNLIFIGDFNFIDKILQEG